MIPLAAQSASGWPLGAIALSTQRAAAEVGVQGLAGLAALLLAQDPDQPETRRRGGLDLGDLRRLLDQQLVGEPRLVGEAFDLVLMRDPRVARGVGDAQAAARRAVGAGHRIGRDREVALMRLMGLIGGACRKKRGGERHPQSRMPKLARCHWRLPSFSASAIRLPVKLS